MLSIRQILSFKLVLIFCFIGHCIIESKCLQSNFSATEDDLITNSSILPTTVESSLAKVTSNDGLHSLGESENGSSKVALSNSNHSGNSVLVTSTETSTDYDDDEDEINVCDGRLSSIVRNFNATPFLPDDFEQVSDSMNKIDVYDQIQNFNDTVLVVERFVQYVQKLKSNKDIYDAALYLSSLFMDKMYQANLSHECSAALVHVMSAIRNKEMWSLAFPDSFGDIMPSGLLRGHISSFGEFDECVSIKSPPLESGAHIYGKYCQVQFKSITPSFNKYDPKDEITLRSHPAFPKLMEFARNANMDNYLNGKLVKMIIEATDAINSNIYHYGVCFPHSCQTTDIEKLFNSVLYPITKIPVRVEERLCDTHKEIRQVRYDKQQWTAIIGLSVLSAIVVFCSLYHIYVLYSDKQYSDKQLLINGTNNNGVNCDKQVPNDLSSNLRHGSSPPRRRTIGQQFMFSFSAIENTRKLLQNDNRFAFLDTIRFILTLGVYSLQAFNFTTMLTLQMLRSITNSVPSEMLHSNAYWFARAPGLLIDGFVFIFGLMLVMGQFSRLKKDKGNFSFFIYLWKRWIRLSVAMVGTFFIIFLFPLVGDGPMWFINAQWLMPPCKSTSSIVSSFLYYSNWNPALANYPMKATFPICNPPTWFLSMSTQLYILAPLVFLPLYRWPRFGVSLTSFIIVISALFTASPRLILGHYNYLEAPKFETVSGIARGFLNYHTNPCQYITTLSIGMLTGYLIKCKPNMQILGGKFVENILWIASLASPVLIYCWHNTFWEVNQVNSELSTLSWFVLSKYMLGGSLAYISYMCCTNRGGIVNRLLSIKLIQPVAKLSYSIYLLRMPTILYRVTSVRYTYELKYYQMLQNIFIDYLITSVLAYFLYLLFEAPSINIMKIFEGDELYFCFKKRRPIDSSLDEKVTPNEIVNDADGLNRTTIQESELSVSTSSKADA